MRLFNWSLLTAIAIGLVGCNDAAPTEGNTGETVVEKDTVEAVKDLLGFVEDVEPVDPWDIEKLEATPQIDGVAEEAWEALPWRPMNYVWLGEPMAEGDFEGRFKLGWTESDLFILAEIKDDTVIDQYRDPLTSWWNDDCIEVFVDEDRSMGGHQFNHSAFAYHIALDGNVVDLGPDENPHLYNEHAYSAWKDNGESRLWEMRIALYDSSYVDGGENSPVALNAGKKIGFMIAYCDNDRSEDRENFIGSNFIAGEDKDQGWKDAGVFREVNLK